MDTVLRDRLLRLSSLPLDALAEKGLPEAIAGGVVADLIGVVLAMAGTPSIGSALFPFSDKPLGV